MFFCCKSIPVKLHTINTNSRVLLTYGTLNQLQVDTADIVFSMESLDWNKIIEDGNFLCLAEIIASMSQQDANELLASENSKYSKIYDGANLMHLDKKRKL